MGARRTQRGRSLILAASARTRSINSLTSISGLVDSIMLAAFAPIVSPDSRKIQPWLRSHGPVGRAAPMVHTVFGNAPQGRGYNGGSRSKNVHRVGIEPTTQ